MNTASQEYVRNAEIRVSGTNISTVSGTGGYFRLANVPAGDAQIVMTYPGARSVTKTVNVAAGSIVSQDFEFALISAQRSLDTEEIYELQAFEVKAEAEGQSKMVAEQKQSINIKQVMSSDNFGDMSEQNLGEFLKYLPGITIDYVETDTRTASMGGMDPKYGYVTLDGNPQANGGSGSFGGNDRQFEFESISMNNIESIEVNKTLTPDMWGDAPAGTVNMRTRSALDRKNAKGSYTFGFIGNSIENGFSSTPRHDDKKHIKTRPRFAFDYSSGAMREGKFGFSINGSFTDIYKEQFRETLSYDYNSSQALAAGETLLNRVNFKDGPKITRKYAGGIKLDYQPVEDLRMTLAASYSYFDDFFANRNLNFRTSSANLEEGSSLTKVIARNTNNANTFVEGTGESTGKLKDNSNISYAANFKRGPWTFDLNLLYSRARERRGSFYYDTMGRTDIRVEQIGWTAERDSIESDTWTIQQTSGPDWYDWASWGSNDERDWQGNKQNGTTEQNTAKLDVSREMDWETPTTYKFGIARNLLKKHRSVTESFRGRYVGPEGDALATEKPQSIATFLIDEGFGGGTAPLPVPDKEAAYQLWVDHPEYYTQSEKNRHDDLTDILSSFRGNTEDVQAAYVMQSSRLGRWNLLGGIRMENTSTHTRVPGEVPATENPYTANTADYARFRFSRPIEESYGEYTDWLPSAAAKYTITDNVFLKLGYNKAIKRPDLNRTAGPWTISINEADPDVVGDEDVVTITIPNPNLKPERSSRISAMLEYYFEPAGTLSVHVFQSKITGAVDTRDDALTADEAGIDDPAYADYFFRTFENLDEERTINGIELSYSQQLQFLTDTFMHGLGIFANLTHTSADPRPKTGTRYIPTSASGGLSWTHGPWFVQLNGTWTSSTYTGASVPDNAVEHAGEFETFKPRTILFFNARYKLTERYNLFVSGDRAYDSGKIWNYESDGRLTRIENYGSQWSFGIRGQF